MGSTAPRADTDLDDAMDDGDLTDEQRNRRDRRIVIGRPIFDRDDDPGPNPEEELAAQERERRRRQRVAFAQARFDRPTFLTGARGITGQGPQPRTLLGR